MNHAQPVHIVFYLFKVVNYFDFTRVPDIRLWHTQGLRLFLSVHFNLFINFFISIFNFHIVLWLGVLLSQENISLIYKIIIAQLRAYCRPGVIHVFPDHIDF